MNNVKELRPKTSPSDGHQMSDDEKLDYDMWILETLVMDMMLSRDKHPLWFQNNKEKLSTIKRMIERLEYNGTFSEGENS